MQPSLSRSLTLPYACRSQKHGPGTPSSNANTSMPDLTCFLRRYLGDAKQRHSHAPQPATKIQMDEGEVPGALSELANSFDRHRSDSAVEIDVLPPAKPVAEPCVTLIVDASSEGIFEVPLETLSRESGYFRRFFERADFKEKLAAATPTVNPKINIPKIPLCDFHDFVRFLESGNVLPRHHSNAPYAIEGAAQRLIRAVRLGIEVDSDQYQRVAMREFFDLGHLLPHPESLINEVFACTSTKASHPFRRLIVAIVAARVGEPIRQQQSQRGMGAARDNRQRPQQQVSGIAFWAMYDAYCRRKRNNLSYPASFEDAIA